MSTFTKSSTREDVRKLLDYASATMKRYVDIDSLRIESTIDTFTTALSQMVEESKRYAEPYRLAVVGDFKVGKSSLINALLAHKNLVAEGVTPTTGAVTELWYADIPSGKVLDNQSNILYEGELEVAARYADQRTPEGKKSSGQGIRVILKKPAEVLRNITIIDTPGLGANAADDRVTIDSLHLADAAILVLAAGKSGGEGALKMAERLRSANKQVTLVVTRADTDPNAAKQSAEELAEVFHGIIDGPPVIFSSTMVQDALLNLAHSAENRDEVLATGARELLSQWGHTELTERILQRHLSSSGSAGIARARSVLGELRKRTKSLHLSASREQDVAANLIEELRKLLDETERIVQEVLNPKIPYLEDRIEDIVDQYVGKLLDSLKEAIEILIDEQMDAGVTEGVKVLWAMVSEEYDQKRNRELKQSFRRLFPAEVSEYTAQDIERAVNRILIAEWKAVVKEVGNKTLAPSIDMEGLMKKVDEHLSKVMAAIAIDLAAAIALFFVPGGVLLNIVELLGGLLLTKGQMSKEDARTALAKRKAGLEIKNQRIILRAQLAGQYRTLNNRIHKMVVENTRAKSNEYSIKSDEATKALTVWREAVKDLSTILETAADIEQGGLI